jgi:hypothetical protein
MVIRCIGTSGRSQDASEGEQPHRFDQLVGRLSLLLRRGLRGQEDRDIAPRLPGHLSGLDAGADSNVRLRRLDQARTDLDATDGHTGEE